MYPILNVFLHFGGGDYEGGTVDEVCCSGRAEDWM